MKFKKGHTSWNKGTKGIMKVNSGSFKKGITPKGSILFKKGEYLNKDHFLWKGENASYSAIHHWLKRHLSKPIKCQNSNCKYPRKDKWGRTLLAPKRFEWANISGEYKRELSDYMSLCVSCHRRLDRNLYKGWITRRANYV